MRKDKAFYNWAHGRFHLNFSNGNHLSTVFADGTYSDNYDSKEDTKFILSKDPNKKCPKFQSDTAEIMFTCGDALRRKILKKYNGGCDDPIPRISIEAWAEIVHLLSTEHIKN